MKGASKLKAALEALKNLTKRARITRISLEVGPGGPSLIAHFEEGDFHRPSFPRPQEGGKNRAKPPLLEKGAPAPIGFQAPGGAFPHPSAPGPGGFSPLHHKGGRA